MLNEIRPARANIIYYQPLKLYISFAEDDRGVHNEFVTAFETLINHAMLTLDNGEKTPRIQLLDSTQIRAQGYNQAMRKTLREADILIGLASEAWFGSDAMRYEYGAFESFIDEYEEKKDQGEVSNAYDKAIWIIPIEEHHLLTKCPWPILSPAKEKYQPIGGKPSSQDLWAIIGKIHDILKEKYRLDGQGLTQNATIPGALDWQFDGEQFCPLDKITRPQALPEIDAIHRRVLERANEILDNQRNNNQYGLPTKCAEHITQLKILLDQGDQVFRSASSNYDRMLRFGEVALVAQDSPSDNPDDFGYISPQAKIDLMGLSDSLMLYAMEAPEFSRLFTKIIKAKITIPIPHGEELYNALTNQSLLSEPGIVFFGASPIGHPDQPHQQKLRLNLSLLLLLFRLQTLTAKNDLKRPAKIMKFLDDNQDKLAATNRILSPSYRDFAKRYSRVLINGQSPPSDNFSKPIPPPAPSFEEPYDTDKVKDYILNQIPIPKSWIPKITKLNLSGFDITDLTPLKGLVNLQDLFLNGTKVADLTPLTGLVNLRRLDAGTKVTDLTPLKGLVNLQTLHLSETQVTDLTPLTGLVNLQSLDLEQTNITDFTPLAGLVNLQILNLWRTNVADLTPLTGLVNLQRLDVMDTQVADLTPLTGLVNLQILNLRGTKVTDLTPLKGLVNLQTLQLRETKVTDLTPLKGLVNLQDLFLNATKVSDLTPLKGLVNLHSLNLIGTKVTDLTPLTGLVNLQSLDVMNTQVADLTPLTGLVNLRIHDVHWDDVI